MICIYIYIHIYIYIYKYTLYKCVSVHVFYSNRPAAHMKGTLDEDDNDDDDNDDDDDGDDGLNIVR
jgi:hypothetical protein